MPLDHYVSQVHLRQFYSPALDGKQMYGFRKRDGHIFPCSSKDVCRVQDGSTNEYLQKDRVIEEFLKTIEPNYNTAIAELRTGRASLDAVYVVAGFAAYVTSCSPAAMRVHAGPLRSTVEATGKILDASGEIPKTPEVLGGKGYTELIESGIIKTTIDEKYPQALGIDGIVDRVNIWGNSAWDILINEHAGNSPFFTTDFASGIELSDDPRIINRLVPLGPDLAIRIRPDLDARDLNKDTTFKAFRCRLLTPSRSEVRVINRTIVRCGEEFVFFRDNHGWVEDFLNKNRSFRVEPVTREIKTPTGYALVSTIRVKSTKGSG
ncbi:hypothetical protein SE92_16995 [Bradyrhizobium sp. AT1]|uniref:DUF4238 domain-containing protein n=1 Tax=Bradyrhizobium sp. AT1 TaxID=574934 RepID=UPI000791D42F|nr:DUF4238 domain-containing protein [Bradyrhizobium sp. AT1]KYG21733.1 hypothetical protein SE92_16995 [Bradyrhizobium sp. AT1]